MVDICPLLQVHSHRCASVGGMVPGPPSAPQSSHTDQVTRTAPLTAAAVGALVSDHSTHHHLMLLGNIKQMVSLTIYHLLSTLVRHVFPI